MDVRMMLLIINIISGKLFRNDLSKLLNNRNYDNIIL